MSNTRLLQISARKLAALIRSRDVSSLAVVEAHIARIEEVDGVVNAVARDRFEAARHEAAAADAALERGAACGPLHGVPFTVKEMIAVEGMPFTFGCRNREGTVSVRDATVVARLRSAGAIVLGVTNVPEWGMWYETYNHVYGRTSNPHAPARTAGGSSGGEAAVVGAGGSPFGVGADVGGSIRIPAAFCGVYGHKPTAGLLPLTGQHPVYDGGPGRRESPYLVTGPLGRSAGDLALLVRIMAGPDGVDPNAEGVPVRNAADVDWRGRRVWLLPEPRVRLARSTAPELAAAVTAAGRILEERGARIEFAPRDLMRDAADLWFPAMQSVGGTSFRELLGGGRQVNVLRESAAALLGRSEYSWPALFFALAEAFGRRRDHVVQHGLARLRHAGAGFRELLGDDGVLIAPVHPRTAPRHNAPVLHPFDFLYTAYFNALRVPATTVPFGAAASGLPLAVQVAASGGNDYLTLAAAMAMEESLPPWTFAQPAGASTSADAMA